MSCISVDYGPFSPRFYENYFGPICGGIYATLVILMVAVQEHLTSDPALASQSSFLASIRFLSPDEEPDSAD
ncbi:hypothetical protein K523DRAFT_358658 [Schizophyllum commune Tattone D]|nr:hypothetical protein K523DRAFT_358658 [Schizophyllum commune Tattone D]